MKQTSRKIAVGFTTLGLMTAAISSHAALTTVNDIWGANGAGGEWNVYNSGVGSAPGNGVMEYLYGTGNFTRVDDSSDIQWGGSPGGASFEAVYAGASQALYSAGLTGSPISSTPILTASGNTGTPSRSGSFTAINPVSQPFLFLDVANGNNAYSDPTLNNLGGVDRMVTFAVNGYLAIAGDSSSYTAFSYGTHYVIAFEDGTDNDYNDLVVEVSGVTPVPETTTVLAGALLLLPLGVSTLRILRKNRVA
jgi:hypothetical protein